MDERRWATQPPGFALKEFQMPTIPTASLETRPMQVLFGEDWVENERDRQSANLETNAKQDAHESKSSPQPIV